MAYQKKSTGIAANCTMCLMVDPDTGTIKDFASAAVTADMTVGANVTIGSQAWDGVNLPYWRPGSGSTDADFIKFGTTKPQFAFNTTNTQRTVVFIGEVAGGGARLFGTSSSDYFSSNNLGAGGSTTPTALLNSNAITGGFPALVSGNKRMLAWSLVRSGAANSSFVYHAADTGTSGDVALRTVGAYNLTWDLSYVNRRNDTTAHQQDKTHAILVFDTALTVSDMDSLLNDFVGVMIEQVAAAIDLDGEDCTQTNISTTGALSAPINLAGSDCDQDNTSTTGVVVEDDGVEELLGEHCDQTNTSTSAGIPVLNLAGQACSQSNGSTTGSLSLVGVGSITTGPFKNNTGTVLAGLTDLNVAVIDYTVAAAPVIVAAFTGKTTHSTVGSLYVSDESIIPGTYYELVTKNADGVVGIETYLAV